MIPGAVSRGVTASTFLLPWAMAVSGTRLYVADPAASRVLAFGLKP